MKKKNFNYFVKCCYLKILLSIAILKKKNI